MFVRTCVELDVTKPLKRCLVLGEVGQEIKCFISYEALWEICFYCGQKKEDMHDYPLKILNMNFIQVERLDNEPTVYLTNMVLDEVLQHQLSEGVILVFPQPSVASSHTGAKFTGERNVDNY
ncbi:Hypothetical predicted protein [Prunus dulcis]|uniref:Uncharacterized protein n=1 Tax=Prunus dulcis TaxID=3755 RepID=A0A5E4FS85_PRUDU|nr:Hypothetical predicted protein [Prunus dulcis]